MANRPADPRPHDAARIATASALGTRSPRWASTTFDRRCDQHARDVDGDRAHVPTGPAERRGVGKRVDLGVLTDTPQEGVEDGADRAGVDRPVGMATDPLVDRAGVEAGGAADAAQRLSGELVGQRAGAAVVEEHDVHLLRPVTGGHARPRRGVGVHPLPGRGPRQQLEEDVEVGPGGHDLLDADHGHEHLGQGEAHPPVALGLHHDKRARSPPQRSSRPRRPSASTGTSRAGAAAPRPRARPGRRSGRAGRAGLRQPSGRGRCRGSRTGCGGSRARGCGSAGRRRAARSARPGRSPRRRSRASASASFRPISWVAIDLTLTTSRMPCRCATSATTAHASPASRAQCTVAPRSVSAASRVTRWSSRWARVSSLIRAALCRSASQLSTSATTAARLARIVPVAWARLRRSWVSARAVRADAGNGGVPRNVGWGEDWGGRPVIAAAPPARRRCMRGPRRGAGSARPHAVARASPRCA